MTGDGRPASVVHEWVNRLRHEVYVARSRDVAAVARVGFMMATFANPDGTSITCGQERLAILTGSSQETVSRAIKVLLAVELVRAQRRPNRNAEYRLQPLMHGNRVDWATHMHLYTDTRQRRRKAAQKEAEIEALLNPEPVAERSPSETVEPVPGGVPEPVPGGGTNSPVTKLEPVPGGGYQYIPTSGSYQHRRPGHSARTASATAGWGWPARQDRSADGRGVRSEVVHLRGDDLAAV